MVKDGFEGVNCATYPVGLVPAAEPVEPMHVLEQLRDLAGDDGALLRFGEGHALGLRSSEPGSRAREVLGFGSGARWVRRRNRLRIRDCRHRGADCGDDRRVAATHGDGEFGWQSFADGHAQQCAAGRAVGDETRVTRPMSGRHGYLVV